MYQREAMWMAFQARHWRPNAMKIAAGKINAVSGKPWSQALSKPSRGADGEIDKKGSGRAAIRFTEATGR